MIVRCFSFAILLICSVGCYEGWEYSKGDGPGDDGDFPGIEEPPKELLYVLFEVFRLAPGAMDDGTCFPEVSSKDYRTNEWNERVSSISDGLGAVAETFIVRFRDIMPDDCLALSAIDLAALDFAPWSPSAGPGPDPLGFERPTVHLKAVFWDEDVAFASPNSQVTKVDWAAMEELIFGGEAGTSLHYFVMSSDESGYLTEWRSEIPDDSLLTGTAIDNIDPSPDGVVFRAQIISNDTRELVQWVLESAVAI